MESLEQLRNRRDGLEELRTVVKTMKALSGANIRQFERAASALADYHRTVELGLHVVLRHTDTPVRHPSHRRHGSRTAAIVFGSDHGLCGRFNENVTRHAIKHMTDSGVARRRLVVLVIGERAAAGLSQSDRSPGDAMVIENVLPAPVAVSQIGATVQQILLQIDAWRNEGDVETVHLYYNRNISRTRYHPTEVRLLPVNLRRLKRLEERPWASRRLPTYTMDRETLFAKLLRQYFFVTLFRACAESQASEHASRLRAMQSAEQNLDEGIGEVTRVFRRARQSVITAELLDVVAGYEAITGT